MAKIFNIFQKQKKDEISLDFSPLTQSGLEILLHLIDMDRGDSIHMQILHKAWTGYLNYCAQSYAMPRMLDALEEEINRDRKDPYAKDDELVQKHFDEKTELYWICLEQAKRAIEPKELIELGLYSPNKHPRLPEMTKDKIVDVLNNGIQQVSTSGIKYSTWKPRTDLKISREEIKKVCGVHRYRSSESDSDIKRPVISKNRYQDPSVQHIYQIYDAWPIVQAMLARDVTERVSPYAMTGLLNSMGEVITDYSAVFSKITDTCQDNEYNRVKKRFQTLLDEALQVGGEKINIHLEQPAKETQDVFYQKLADATSSIESQKLFIKQKATRKN